MKNIFDLEVTNEFIERINKLSPTTKSKWGKMSIDQVLAHLNVTYDYVYTDKYTKPKGFKRFILKMLVKPIVVGEKEYKENSRTAPDFIITDKRQFEIEKEKLIVDLKKTQQLGADHFDNKESHSFGPLKSSEWNNMFVKHLEHHLKQFGV